jgi:hypothetical protein
VQASVASDASAPAQDGKDTTARAARGAAKGYAEHYLGITDAERSWYKQLGVDPSADNRVLREAIFRKAKL